MSSLKTTLFAFAALAGSLLVGCAPKETTETPVEPAANTTTETPKEPELAPLADAPADGDEVIVMDTAQGKIVLMLYPDRAPKTVENFKKLVKDKFYDGIRFHRVIPGFMVQGGDPNSKDLARKGEWGQGGPGYTIDDELNDIKHDKGILSMAHAGPNTGGSQFFIMDGVAPHLDGVHTAFGKVVSGQDVVDKIIVLPVESDGPSGNNRPIDDKASLVKTVTIATWPVKS